MTLRALGDAFGIPVESVETLTKSTTLAFALDYGYIEQFKVFLFSFLEAKTCSDCPISIYTDDERVLNDPIVNIVADKIIYIDQDLRERLYEMARDNVKRPERGHWNRGTFLKWAVFDEQETEQLLFLDVDMLCTKPIESLLNADYDGSFICAPQFQRNINRQKDGTPVASDIIAAKLRSLIRCDFDEMHKWRINSGMMLLRGRFISRSFRDEIFSFARGRIDLHEQAHLSEYFRESSEIQMISSVYNFQESFLYTVQCEEAHDIAKRVHIMHYSGSLKPWNRAIKISERPTALIWHAYRTAAAPFLQAVNRPRP